MGTLIKKLLFRNALLVQLDKAKVGLGNNFLGLMTGSGRGCFPDYPKILFDII